MNFGTIRNKRKRFAKGKCEICGYKGSECHHVFGGKNRKIAERFDTVIWLCKSCHQAIHGQDFRLKKRLQAERCKVLIDEIGEEATLKLLGKLYFKTEDKIK